MTATLLEVHEAIRDQANESIPNIRCDDFPPQAINPPHSWVAFDAGGDQTMARGVNSYTFNFYVATGAMGDRAGYRALVAYLDPEGDDSVRAALTAGNTATGYRDLTGVNVSAIDVRVPGMEELGGFQGYVAVFPLTVTITKG